MTKLSFKHIGASIWTKAALTALIAYPAGLWAQAQTDIIISQKNRTYAPGAVEISAGQSLKIVNDDIFLHHAFVKSKDMTFDSGSMEEGESARVTFPVPGTFHLKCAIHPKMNLDVTVR